MEDWTSPIEVVLIDVAQRPNPHQFCELEHHACVNAESIYELKLSQSCFRGLFLRFSNFTEIASFFYFRPPENHPCRRRARNSAPAHESE
jgi:hypothetical protein